jgi:hypothetical protein
MGGFVLLLDTLALSSKAAAMLGISLRIWLLEEMVSYLESYF